MHPGMVPRYGRNIFRSICTNVLISLLKLISPSASEKNVKRKDNQRVIMGDHDSSGYQKHVTQGQKPDMENWQKTTNNIKYVK